MDPREQNRIEALLRQGQIYPAKVLFGQLNLRKLNRSQRWQAANFARRLGFVSTGMRLLHSVIYPEIKSQTATELERAEYANLLVLNGNLAEAFSLLQNIKLPESYLAKAWNHFEQWEYGEAEKLLRIYLSQQKDPYYLCVGKINLAEALWTNQKFEEALKYLISAIEYSSKQNHFRLQANALHIRARVFEALTEFKRSARDLSLALDLFGKSNTMDSFLLHRQLAFNKALKEKSERVLVDFQMIAAEKRQWESLREIDFYRLRIRFQKSLFDKLFFGTPYQGFKGRMRTAFQVNPTETTYIWGSKAGKTIELESPRLFTKQSQMLLHSFLQDQYAPQSLGKLFAAVFPGERFDWNSSPNRIHQVTKRLRDVFIREKIPVALKNRWGFYFLEPKGNLGICFSVEEKNDLKVRSPIEYLKLVVGEKFSAGQARKVLGLPKSTVARFLASAVLEKKIDKIGMSKATRYMFRK